MSKRIIAFILVVVLALPLFAGCARERTVTTGEVGVIQERKSQNIYIGGWSVEQFNALGFAYGDSLNICFDNGKTIEDIPYYSGYYTPVGGLLACGNEGSPHVVIVRNCGASTWEEFGLTNASKVTVTLAEKGKYQHRQALFAAGYSDKREDYDSDSAFANFRAVKGGKLQENAFYRSASPCDNTRCRAAYADKFVGQAGIRFVLNFSDNAQKYQAHTARADFQSPHYDALYREGNVLLLAADVNYREDVFAKKLSKGFLAMTEREKPVLIHCVEGKDRTGFACALLLALAGASAQEIADDYMLTFKNYYGITQQKNPEQYEAVLENVYDFFDCLCGAEKGTMPEASALKTGAENYLRRGGLSQAHIAAIEGYLAGE
ncbi:MAG: tyrosine-protein phosphatase [Clostridia bacterium]|nr:tyrosine-protein phosphatase [Clostridia bacterium]